MMKYDELVEKAINMLKDDEELYIEVVDTLNGYNGFAYDFVVYDMYLLSEFCCDMSVSDFLLKLDEDFNLKDGYFYYDIDGKISSVNDKYVWYLDHMSEEEVFDNIKDNFCYVDISNRDFEELLEAIDNYNEESEED